MLNSFRFILAGVIVLISLVSLSAEYFVDSINGDDSAAGTSPNNPWKTLKRTTRKGELKPGDVVRLACGRVWREQLVPVSGECGKLITYTSYNPTPNVNLPPPAIQSSLDRSKASDWNNIGDGLWETEGVELDVGLLLFNDGEKWGVKKWNDERWKKSSDSRYAKSIGITKELDFWYDEKSKKVILKCESNPGEKFNSIELCYKKDIISSHWAHDVVYDGLWVRYGSAHGIAAGLTKNIVIRNCRISWIGGSLQYWRKDDITGEILYPVRYGNGIEFWGETKNALVESNTVWQIYDAALTNQGRKGVQSEIRWRNNKVEKAEFSFEYWHAGETRDIVFEGNVCRDAGFGWGHDQRPDINGAHLLFYENKAITENFVVRNNTFINARNWTVRMENDWRKSLRIENNMIRSLPGVPVIRWITGMHEAFFDIDGFKALGFN